MKQIYLLQAIVIFILLSGCTGDSVTNMKENNNENTAETAMTEQGDTASDTTVLDETVSDTTVTENADIFSSESSIQDTVQFEANTEDPSAESGKQEAGETTPSPTDSADSTTAGDYYSTWTNYSASEVEAFALGVKEDILSGNWEALSQKISYPIIVNGVTYSDSTAFLSEDWSSVLNQDFLSEVQGETCHEMFSNWEGCMFGTGQVWISEVDDSLKLIAINP